MTGNIKQKNQKRLRIELNSKIGLRIRHQVIGYFFVLFCFTTPLMELYFFWCLIVRLKKQDFFTEQNDVGDE